MNRFLESLDELSQVAVAMLGGALVYAMTTDAPLARIGWIAAGFAVLQAASTGTSVVKAVRRNRAQRRAVAKPSSDGT